MPSTYWMIYYWFLFVNHQRSSSFVYNSPVRRSFTTAFRNNNVQPYIITTRVQLRLSATTRLAYHPLPPIISSFRRFHLAMSSSSSSDPPPSAAAASNAATSTNNEDQTIQHRKRLKKFIDIGANLMDDRYRHGAYFGKQRHSPDFEAVLERSIEGGVTHLILTAGTLEESREALRVVREYRNKVNAPTTTPTKTPLLFLGCTVGVHPTRCQQEFVDSIIQNDNDDNDGRTRTADEVLQELLQIAEDGVRDGSVVAIGEIGLDYDRLQFSAKDVQQQFLSKQLQLFRGSGASKEVASLPLFLHNRNVGRDLILELKRHQATTMQQQRPLTGVVHSFDDSLELAHEIIDLGLYIGLNGCSLKTEQNLKVVRELPLSRLLLETDCPYCEIKPTHAGYKYIQTFFEKKPEKKFVVGMGVKGRNEPNQIVQVAEVIAGVKGITVEEVADTCYQNSLDLYGFSQQSF